MPSGAVYLGPPWGAYAGVMFQKSSLSEVVNGGGRSEWSATEPRTQHVSFEEYGNSGPGAAGTRASFSTKASAPIAIAEVLGSGYKSWVDTSYLS